MLKLFFFFFSASILLCSSSDWKFIKEKNDIKIYTRIKKSGSNLKEFKATTTFKFTKSQVEKEFVDISKMNQWYEMVEKVELIEKISSREAIYKIKFDFPFGVSDRYATIKAKLSYDKDNNLLVSSKSHTIKHNPFPDCVYVSNLESKWIFSGSDNNLAVEHSGFMDPAGNIPEWMVNTNLTDGPIKSIGNLSRRLKSGN